MVIAQDHICLLPAVIFLLVRQIVGGVSFFLHQIAAVFFVAQDAQDHAAAPRPAACGRHAGFIEFARNGVRAFAVIHKFAEDIPYDLRARLVDDQHPAAHVIAEQVAAEHDALFHAALLPPLDALGGAAALLLRDGGENRQPQLGVSVERIEVVAQKQHADAKALELACVINAVERVAREAGDLLRHDQVEHPRTRTGNHALKCQPLFRAGAGEPLVGKDARQFPAGLPGDVFPKVALLALEGVCLIVPVG